MLLLQAKELIKTYGVETVLDGIDLQIRENERIGLVGVNGAGKSTLLKVLTGELERDSGNIHWAKDATFGYLAQQTGITGNRTLWDECMTVFAHIQTMKNELRELERKMSDETVLANAKRHEHVMRQYAERQETFEKAGGYSCEARIRSVLDGLGLAKFPPRTTMVSELSGGQKTRLALAKLLLQQPDLLMLDEPTNYLDLATLEWLETFLRTYRGALLIVSHDRYFLNALVETIWELDHGALTPYNGNYTRFIEQKEAEFDRLEKAYVAQQAEIKRMEEFVQKNLARASTSKRAQSRQKMLDKMERIERPQMKRKRAAIHFDVQQMSGQEVLSLTEVTIGYAEKTPLCHNVDVLLERGERVALIGPNGIGKTTLLKTAAGLIEPLSGIVRHGTNVTIGYYDQEQQHLNPHKSVLDELWDRYPEQTEQDIRSILGQFLFSGDDVFKRVKQLSGGEKARLSLAQLTLQQANFLLLDEPTNHLDLYNKEQLEQALLDFAGTLLFISHDRYFINKLATRVLELSTDGLSVYLGNYDDYVAKKSALKAQASHTATAEENIPSEGRKDYEEERQQRNEKRKRARLLTETETIIAQLEQAINEKEQQLTQPEVYSDYTEASRIENELEQLRQQLDDALNEWSELADDA